MFKHCLEFTLATSQSLQEEGEVPGSSQVPHNVVEQADDVNHLRICPNINKDSFLQLFLNLGLAHISGPLLLLLLRRDVEAEEVHLVLEVDGQSLVARLPVGRQLHPVNSTLYGSLK